jgi:acetyl-CoA/propionyl-CoA carboxylase biotin carboxyl carrier protein
MGPALLPEKLHHEMGEAALALAQAIEFVGVGRVRWALTPHGGWYLLGLSSRLTTGYSLVEEVHHIDLVETQQRVLDGEELGWDGGETLPGQSGFQLRILHMDPENGNARPTGVIKALEFPEGVTVVKGTEVGQLCTHHTEPLIASIIVTGPSREAALERARDALKATRIEGIVTNKSVLENALRDPEYGQ